jgi:hypothetical protein
LQKV